MARKRIVILGGGTGGTMTANRLRRRFDAVGAVSERDLVEIDLENLVLRILSLDFERYVRFPQLAAEGLVPATDVLIPDVPRQLHRDRGEPLGKAKLEQVGPDGAEDPVPVDPMVVVEALVFGGEEGGLHIGRHLTQRDHRAPLQPEVGDQPAIRGVHL